MKDVEKTILSAEHGFSISEIVHDDGRVTYKIIPPIGAELIIGSLPEAIGLLLSLITKLIQKKVEEVESNNEIIEKLQTLAKEIENKFPDPGPMLEEDDSDNQGGSQSQASTQGQDLN